MEGVARSKEYFRGNRAKRENCQPGGVHWLYHGFSLRHRGMKSWLDYLVYNKYKAYGPRPPSYPELAFSSQIHESLPLLNTQVANGWSRRGAPPHQAKQGRVVVRSRQCTAKCNMCLVQGTPYLDLPSEALLRVFNALFPFDSDAVSFLPPPKSEGKGVDGFHSRSKREPHGLSTETSFRRYWRCMSCLGP